MTDDRSFLQGLVASPNDNALRLVYADWLEEQGDPRGSFLRTEVALHQSQLRERNSELQDRLYRSRLLLDPSWVALVERPLVGWRIARSRPQPKMYGKAIPAFIHNGSYFLATVDVYADGAINCWGFVDLHLFKDKLAKGWVVPRARVGGDLSIHNLGQARVAAANWDLNSNDIESEVMEALRELNPPMKDLLDMQGTDTEVRNGVRYAKLGMGDAKPYRMNLEGDEILGKELPVFEVVGDEYRLRRWFIYADGQTQLGYGNELLSIELVTKMFEKGQLTLSVPGGKWVKLDGLGRFQTGQGWWGIKPGERVREAESVLEELNGGPGAISRCIEAHVDYQADPSPKRRKALRQAYQAVPEHLRMFCGDMDTKDRVIRRILANDEGEDDV